MSEDSSSAPVRMVDVGQKPVTQRVARASARLRMQPATAHMIRNRQIPKGDVLQVAVVAGVMAAKRTSDIVPLCHPIPVDGVDVQFTFPEEGTIRIEATVRAAAKTGVEMEALTAVTAAALSIYDMCKAVDRWITIEQIQLEEKQGGKSGHLVRPDSSGRG